MAVETVLLAMLGVVALWLVFDAGRERHRLRARMERSSARSRPAVAAPATTVSGTSTAATGTPPRTGAEDGSVGPRF